MPIEATTPTIIPPAAAPAVYGEWWIQSFAVDGSDPANVTANVTLRKSRVVGGARDFSPLESDVVSIALNDVMTLATNDIHVGTIMATMLAHIQAYGRTLNLL